LFAAVAIALGVLSFGSASAGNAETKNYLVLYSGTYALDGTYALGGTTR
jgi:hypothetical protein